MRAGIRERESGCSRLCVVISNKRRLSTISEEIFVPILLIIDILLGEMGCGEVSIVGDINEIWQEKKGEDQDAAASKSKIP